MSIAANAEAIFQGLTGGGLSPVAASGVLGNIEAESGGDLNSVGSGGGGLLGYTPISSAPPGGAPGSPLSAQISAALAYIQNSYPGGIAHLNSITDPEQAGESFAQYGERCAACTNYNGAGFGQLPIRGANAQQVFAAFEAGTLGSAGTGAPASGTTAGAFGIPGLPSFLDPGTAISGAESTFVDWATKAMFIVLGLALAGLGIWKLANPGKSATSSVTQSAKDLGTTAEAGGSNKAPAVPEAAAA